MIQESTLKGFSVPNMIQKKNLYLKFEKVEITMNQKSYTGGKNLQNKYTGYKSGTEFSNY